MNSTNAGPRKSQKSRRSLPGVLFGLKTLRKRPSPSRLAELQHQDCTAYKGVRRGQRWVSQSDDVGFVPFRKVQRAAAILQTYFPTIKLQHS